MNKFFPLRAVLKMSHVNCKNYILHLHQKKRFRLVGWYNHDIDVELYTPTVPHPSMRDISVLYIHCLVIVNEELQHRKFARTFFHECEYHDDELVDQQYPLEYNSGDKIVMEESLSPLLSYDREKLSYYGVNEDQDELEELVERSFYYARTKLWAEEESEVIANTVEQKEAYSKLYNCIHGSLEFVK